VLETSTLTRPELRLWGAEEAVKSRPRVGLKARVGLE